MFWFTLYIHIAGGKFGDKDTPPPISGGFPRHSVFSGGAQYCALSLYQRKEIEILVVPRVGIGFITVALTVTATAPQWSPFL